MLVNLGASLSRSGKSVMLLDAGMGSGGVADYLGVMPDTTLEQVARGGSALQSAVTQVPQGFAFSVLATTNSRQPVVRHPRVTQRIDATVDMLARKYDALIVGAMLDKNDFLPLPVLSDGAVIVQVSDTAESIKSAYTMIKRLNSALGRRPCSVLVTGSTEARAKVVFENMEKAASRYLAVPLTSIGCIPDDDHVARATRLGRPVIDAFPHAGASLAFRRIADSFIGKVAATSGSLAMATGTHSFMV